MKDLYLIHSKSGLKVRYDAKKECFYFKTKDGEKKVQPHSKFLADTTIERKLISNPARAPRLVGRG